MPTILLDGRTAMVALGPPKPPAHAPLALRRSGLVLWTPSHPCNAQQIMAAGNELAWTPEVGCVESVDGHSSSTTPPVCTTKGGENGRRKVHEVAEQHDKAGVERRQAILVLFATASAHGALQTKCGNCPQIRASRFWTARISPGAACKSAPARRVHRLWGGGPHVAGQRSNKNLLAN